MASICSAMGKDTIDGGIEVVDVRVVDARAPAGALRAGGRGRIGCIGEPVELSAGIAGGDSRTRFGGGKPGPPGRR